MQIILRCQSCCTKQFVKKVITRTPSTNSILQAVLSMFFEIFLN
uniref:Uncharacterized protein n=1 Tax=Arundo donax TaxID=35708 RepID=A0A0A9EWL2_ARUDO